MTGLCHLDCHPPHRRDSLQCVTLVLRLCAVLVREGAHQHTTCMCQHHQAAAAAAATAGGAGDSYM